MVKQNDKIEAMREGGAILAQIMRSAIEAAKEGVSGMDIENLVADLMKKNQVEPSFTKVAGYKYSTCICVNDAVVHGVPTGDKFKKDDIVGIDIGVYHKGFHTDMSWSKVVGEGKETAETKKRKKFLQAGSDALLLAIEQVSTKKRIGDISQTIQKNVEKEGFNVVKQLVGHAVGKELHEFPQIPGILSKSIEKTPQIASGMALAVEIIYTEGSSEIVYKNNDGWTISTKDGSLSGLFEATVGVLENKTEVLTPFRGLLIEPKFAIIN